MNPFPPTGQVTDYTPCFWDHVQPVSFYLERRRASLGNSCGPKKNAINNPTLYPDDLQGMVFEFLLKNIVSRY